MSAPKVLIMAGGTGGHIFPALAVAHNCISQGCQVSWLGAERGMEKNLLAGESFPLHLIKVSAVMGGGIKRKLFAPFNIFGALVQAYRVIKPMSPDVVIGFGGYASGPGALVAKCLGIPTVIHEQNATPGFTNRIVAKLADVILQAFDGAFSGKNVKTVGNPVRINEVPERNIGLPLKVLVLGGSSGAESVNQLVVKALEILGDQPIELWHQCGKGKLEDTETRYSKLDIDYKVSEFIDDMQAAYEWADLVIGRAGAATISEIAVARLPSLLIPYPWHKDRQQYANADVLSKLGAGIVLDQFEINSSDLAKELQHLISNVSLLDQMSAAAGEIAIPDSAGRVTSALMQCAKGQH